MTMVLSQLQENFQTENRSRQKKNRPLCIMSLHDTLHTALFAMNESPMIPKAKSRISPNKKIQDTLIQNKFVKEVTDKQLLKNCEYNMNDVNYYIITQKGHEYLKRFEYLRELFDDQ